MIIQRSYILRCLKPIIRCVHYLADANPVRQPKDLVNCLMSNIVMHDDQVIVFNKPPGLMVLDETWDRAANDNIENEDGEKSTLLTSTPCTIQYHMPKFRMALQWDHFFPCIRTPNEPSGLLIYTKNRQLQDDIKSTAMRSFRKSKEPYLTLYGITTAIPREQEGSLQMMVERHLYNQQHLSFEVFNSSSNAIKDGRVYNGTVQHKTLSVNDALKVALVEFKTTTCTWDFVELYCLRQCAPLLGDHKYWNRVKNVGGVPMYVNPIKYKITPAKQQLGKHVRLALDLYGQQIHCPLHLHLADFNLTKKYRGQRAVVHYQAKPLSYFFETLERLQLKFPENLNMNKPDRYDRDHEFEAAITT